MDEHRERLDKRLTPIHLFKLTPGTSCGECGLPTCLAFATQVIVGQADIDACPHLDREATEPFRVRLVEQQRAGIGVKRRGLRKGAVLPAERGSGMRFQAACGEPWRTVCRDRGHTRSATRLPREISRGDALRCLLGGRGGDQSLGEDPGLQLLDRGSSSAFRTVDRNGEPSQLRFQGEEPQSPLRRAPCALFFREDGSFGGCGLSYWRT